MTLDALASWLPEQRWFAGAGQADGSGGTTAPIASMEEFPLPTSPPMSVALAAASNGDCYQLLLSRQRADDEPATDSADRPKRRTGRTRAAAAGAAEGGPADGSGPPERGQDPTALAALARFVTEQGTSAPDLTGAAIVGRWLPDAEPLGKGPTHLLSGEQSNTSAIVGGTHVLKVFRRLQSGPHPEVEIGRHLAAVAAAAPAPVPALGGWYELSAESGDATVLGVVQELVPGSVDGWAFVLEQLERAPDQLMVSIRSLGVALAGLHGALARPAVDPDTDDPEAPEAFGATALGAERLRSVAEGVTRDAQRILPQLAAPGDEGPAADLAGSAAELAGSAEDVAGLVTELAAAVGDDTGVAIRHHGDLHLGQTLVGDGGWRILDFEGEPNRPLAERRLRHSPLRDVAGMLRSLAYAVATHRSRGRHVASGWEPAARAAFLDGYLASVDPALLPASPVATMRLLELFELEKVVYELGYELSHRPTWVHLPAAGLAARLDRSAA